MVQGEKKDGVCEWYDIEGYALDKYVAEQGEFLTNKIKNMIVENPDIINKQKKDIIYVISPFKNVAYQLSKELNKIKFTRYDKKGKPRLISMPVYLVLHFWANTRIPLFSVYFGDFPRRISLIQQFSNRIHDQVFGMS